MSKLTIGDYVKHIHFNWHGKLKITAINYGTCTLENPIGNVLYYTMDNLQLWSEVDDKDWYGAGSVDEHRGYGDRDL